MFEAHIGYTFDLFRNNLNLQLYQIDNIIQQLDWSGDYSYTNQRQVYQNNNVNFGSSDVYFNSMDNSFDSFGRKWKTTAAKYPEDIWISFLQEAWFRLSIENGPVAFAACCDNYRAALRRCNDDALNFLECQWSKVLFRGIDACGGGRNVLQVVKQHWDCTKAASNTYKTCCQ